MQMDLSSLLAAGQEPRAKRGRNEEDADGGSGNLLRDVAKLTVLSSKLALVADLSAREAAGDLATVAMIYKDSNLVLAIRGARRQYDKATENKKGHGQGTGAQWLYKALCVFCLADALPEAKDIILLHASALNRPLDFLDVVTVFKEKDAYNKYHNKERVKLTVHFGSKSQQIRRLFIQWSTLGDGNEILFGLAPRGVIARKTQSALDSLQQTLA
eukprot:CAMPEP_0172884362 /NCGR_PEP_ID=MMETSP1075-20121228/124951_1 /TAXON_ID=2916 /ORGANISM="Ceratium fusus, Strain PA161109" /LENGTH=214 /DNA_ID=CAMNT_0013737443 /DNA_START=81 /DNA_END=726 /DNA_ORIENTATION=+